MTTQHDKPILLLKPPVSNGLHPGGRPSYTLDDNQRALVANLARIGVAKYLIAQSFGVAPDTVDDNDEFSEIYKKHYCQAGIRVAHKQFELLEGENPYVSATMAVWLGKQHLGQSDRSEQHTQSDITIRIELADKRSRHAQLEEGQRQSQIAALHNGNSA